MDKWAVVCVFGVKALTWQVERPREEPGQQSLCGKLQETQSHWRVKFKGDGAAQLRLEGQVGRAVVLGTLRRGRGFGWGAAVGRGARR